MPKPYPAAKVATDIKIAVKEMENEVEALLNRLELEYDKLIASGVSARVANKTILDGVKNETGYYGTWRNTQKKIVSRLQNDLVAKPMMFAAMLEPGELFKWILDGGVKEHCSDCSSLSKMEPRTVSNWKKLGFGLPREGGTICDVGCKCLLEKI